MTKHRTLRRVAAGSVALSMGVVMVGCGSSDDKSSSDEKTTTTAAAAEAKLSTEQATAAATTYADLVFASLRATPSMPPRSSRPTSTRSWPTPPTPPSRRPSSSG